MGGWRWVVVGEHIFWVGGGMWAIFIGCWGKVEECFWWVVVSEDEWDSVEMIGCFYLF